MSESGGESSDMEEEVVRQGFARVDRMFRALSWSSNEHDVDGDSVQENLNAVLDQIRDDDEWPWVSEPLEDRQVRASPADRLVRVPPGERPVRANSPSSSEYSLYDETEDFDIDLPTAHSYLATEVAEGDETIPLAEIRGPVFEEGWKGKLFCFPHPMVVLPGEVVPLLIRDPAEVSLYRDALLLDRAFCLLLEGERLGVVCRVLEGGGEAQLGVRARACGRVLADEDAGDVSRRRGVTVLRERMRAERPHAGSVWPDWVYSYPMKAAEQLRAYLAPTPLPADVESLSWRAGGALPPPRREAMLRADCAWTRVVLALRGWRERLGGWACGACGRRVAEVRHEQVMSSEGVGAAYTNPGGVMHDVLTVSQVQGAVTSGGAHSSCTWFPGYRWTVLLCAGCHSHLGWKYDATRKRLRPQTFYGLTRTNLALADTSRRR